MPSSKRNGRRRPARGLDVGDLYGSDPADLYTVYDPTLEVDPMAAPIGPMFRELPPSFRVAPAQPPAFVERSMAPRPAPAQPMARPAPQAAPSGLPTVPGMRMPRDYDGPVSPALLPQYGGRYMPPRDQWAAELDAEQQAGRVGLGQLPDIIQARQKYDESIPGRANRLSELQGEAEEIQGGLSLEQLAIQDLENQRQQALEREKRAELAANDLQRRELAQARADAVERETQRYRTMADQIRSTEIDPERYWKNKTSGQKVQSTIALFLGTLGSGLAQMGGVNLPNLAWEKIQGEIERDIAAQSENMANKRDGLAAQSGLLGMVRQHYDDLDQAKIASEAMMLRNYASLTNSLALDSGSKDIAARGKALSDLLDNAAAQREQALQLQAAESEELARQQAAAAAAAAAQAQAARLADLENLGWEDIDTDDARKRIIPGLGLMAYTSDDAKVIKDAAAKVGTINDALRDLEALIDRGADVPYSEASKEYESKQAVLLSAINVAQGQGAISESDAERVLKSVPNAAALGKNANAKAALRTTRQYMDNMLRREAVARGAVPIERRYGMVGAGPKAKVVRQFRMVEQPKDEAGGAMDVESLFTPTTQETPLTVREVIDKRYREQGGAGGAPPGVE